MSVTRKILITVLLASVVLSACGAETGTEVPTLDVNAIMTAGVGTFIANMYQTQTAQALLVTNTASPTITSSPTTPPPTGTQAPIILNPILPTVFKSPTATGTQFTPTPNPGLLASGCNNLRLLRDESIPDGTVVKPGATFTKVWKVENNGTCNWVILYRLVFVGGDRMDGEPPALGKIIVPYGWPDLSIKLTAPNKPGKYTGIWRMGTQSGTPFGSNLTVSIIVGSPTDTPQPTSTAVPPTATLTPTLTPTNTPVTPSSYP